VFNIGRMSSALVEVASINKGLNQKRAQSIGRMSTDVAEVASINKGLNL